MLHLAFLLALSPQADPAARFVEKLGSDSLEEREEATRALKALGKPALPALEKAAKSSDLEVAARAERLLRVIPFAEHLTDRVLSLMPGVEDRLRVGDDHTWTRVFLDAVAVTGLQAGDLDPMVAKAFAGVQSGAEARIICAAAEAHRLRSAIPGLAKLLRDSSGDTRAAAVKAFGELGARERSREIEETLRDSYLYARAQACWTLAQMDARTSVKDIVPLLSDRQELVRSMAAKSLCWLGAREGVPLVLEEGKRLSFLNALRQPAAWKRLGEGRSPAPRGPFKDAVGRVAADAGMKVEVSPSFAGRDSFEGMWGGFSPRQTIDLMLDEGLTGEFVIERDRIRILNRDEALRFWKEWWDEEQRKK